MVVIYEYIYWKRCYLKEILHFNFDCFRLGKKSHPRSRQQQLHITWYLVSTSLKTDFKLRVSIGHVRTTLRNQQNTLDRYISK